LTEQERELEGFGATVVEDPVFHASRGRRHSHWELGN